MVIARYFDGTSKSICYFPRSQAPDQQARPRTLVELSTQISIKGCIFPYTSISFLLYFITSPTRRDGRSILVQRGVCH